MKRQFDTRYFVTPRIESGGIQHAPSGVELDGDYPFYHVICAIDTPQPEWCLTTRPIGRPWLEFALLRGEVANLPRRRSAATYRFAVYDPVLVCRPPSDCRVRLKTESAHLWDAALGIIGLVDAPQLVGFDLDDLEVVMGCRKLAGPNQHFQGQKPSPVEGTCFVVDAFPTDFAAVGPLIRERLKRCADDGFSGGVAINCLVGAHAMPEMTLQHLDALTDVALADRGDQPCTANISVPGGPSKIVVYAFAEASAS